MPLRAAHRHPDQLHSGAGPRGQLTGLLAQQPHHLAADGAAAQQRNPDRARRVHRATSSRNWSSSVSRRSSTRAAPSRTATTAGRGSRL